MRILPALACAALLCAPASAAVTLSDYAGFWSGTLKGFKGAYSVAVSLSQVNDEFYGSYSVQLAGGAGPARGSFVLSPEAGGCYLAKINLFGAKAARTSAFCQRSDGGFSFYLDALGGAVTVDMEPGFSGLNAAASGREDEIRGRLARRTPRKRPPAGRASKGEKAGSVPLLRGGEEGVKIKKPPRL